MSLENLLKITTATIKRLSITQDSAGGQIRNYTAAARGSLPTTSKGRLQPTIQSSRRAAFAQKDEVNDGDWITQTNPQCSNQDQITVNGIAYFVQGQSEPDGTVNLYYVLSLKAYGLGLQ